MHLPEEIQNKIEEIIQSDSRSSLKKAQENLSTNYRHRQTSDSIFDDPYQKLAYLAARFPATFAAASRVFSILAEQMPHFFPATILDIGAGPATATLAASFIYPQIHKAFLLERNRNAIDLGKKLLQSVDIHEPIYLHQDMQTVKEFPNADLCIFSYSLGELSNSEKLFANLCNSSLSTFIFLEPGTPSGFQMILKARNFFLENGFKIVAPCPHEKSCPLKENDWCHFSVRLERSKLHRLLKAGDLGYEDEKFSYVIFTKLSFEKIAQHRIIRHPFKGSGHMKFTLCSTSGEKEEIVVTKKNREFYKKAKETAWGDLLPTITDQTP